MRNTAVAARLTQMRDLLRAPAGHRLRDQLRGEADALVLVAPEVSARASTRLRVPAVQTFHLAVDMPRPAERDTVILVVSDLVGLRRVVTGIANMGSARRIAVWFERPVRHLPILTPRPEWPPLLEVVGSRVREHFVLFSFISGAPVRQVLLQVSRAASPGATMATGWPLLGFRRDEPERWPPADPAARVKQPPELFDVGAVDVPPDVVVAGRDTPVPPEFGQASHPVLGRPVRMSLQDPDMTWDQVNGLSETAAADALAPSGPASLGAVDEGLLNPIGFDRAPVGAPADLTPGPGATLDVVPPGASASIRLDPAIGLSDVQLPEVRRLPGIRLGWAGGPGPRAYCRLVTQLAATGVPMTTDRVPAWGSRLLVPDLVAALSGGGDLEDPLRREEHSIRLRRAALRGHSSRPWRRALSHDHGLKSIGHPALTVVLATRRPEMLSFALRQVARQRGVDYELVLATHGFEAPQQELAAFRRIAGRPLTTVAADSGVPFGEVLNQAVARASGELVLKMDDDDWYGPDFAADLLLARRYSGAEVVGCAAEYIFLQPLQVTVRRPDPSECYRPLVAGGTMLMDRGALRAVGGFRDTTKYVDANLLFAVRAAGCAIYRTHGLGYVLRRGSVGHTWDPGLGYFLASKRVAAQWRGFRPSALMEPAPEDEPDPVGSAVAHS